MLERVAAAPMPDWALLQRYARQPGCYTDSFAVDVDGLVALPDYARAFYGSRLFGLERMILMAWMRQRIPPQDAVAVARGDSVRFAVWTAEARREGELLLCDPGGRTRSWLAVEPRGVVTRLWFGSAVLPGADGVLGRGVLALIPLHTAYSRALLSAAQRNL